MIEKHMILWSNGSIAVHEYLPGETEIHKTIIFKNPTSSSLERFECIANSGKYELRSSILSIARIFGTSIDRIPMAEIA